MKAPAPISMWTADPPPPEVRQVLDRLARAEGVRRLAVMPDVHLAADVCVGTVIATDGRLYPNAVGGDIGCGVATVAFDGEAERVDRRETAAAILTGLYRAVPIVRHHRSATASWPRTLLDRPLSASFLERRRATEALLQLGTLGSGNHFLELQADEDGRLWLMVHSGSRAIGQAIRDHHQSLAERGPGGLRSLAADSPDGRAYLADMAWAIDYAEANRRSLVEAARAVVKAVLGVDIDDATYVSCHHNHVREETHDGETVWVHRKGAISAAAGEQGLVPGSMGTASVHVVGRGHTPALCSSAHGAGRRLGRTEARGEIGARDVMRELRNVWFDHRLAGRIRDEAPSAYKDLDEVLEAQRDLVHVVRRLRPVLCFKGA